MTPSRRLASAFVLLAIAIAASAGPVAAATPNHSLFLYKPGRAVTGTLKDGAWVKKRSIGLNGVSLAAASRTSLALYTKDTGRLRTGTFKGGVYTPVESINVRSGYSHMAASCDTLILYNRLTGRTMVGTLVGGRLRARSTTTLLPGWNQLAASCDTVWFSRKHPSGNSENQFGVLSGGDVVMNAGTFLFASIHVMAMTKGSFILLNGLGYGGFGPAVEGLGYVTDWRYDFAPFDRLVGTANTLLFYRVGDGVECRSTLIGGVYVLVDCADQLDPGWKVFAGGR